MEPFNASYYNIWISKFEERYENEVDDRKKYIALKGAVPSEILAKVSKEAYSGDYKALKDGLKESGARIDPFKDKPVP